jgi:hypothetical protein
VAPVKQRRRGLSPGALTVSIAECQLAGAECFDDLEVFRADQAGASLRAVAQIPSAATARQLACQFKPAHIRAIERAVARCGNQLDRQLGRDPGEEVTLDLDATETKLFGRRKQGDRTQPPGSSGLQQLCGEVGAARAGAHERAEGW